MAELVDALVSGTSGATRGGSSPLLGTKHKTTGIAGFFVSGAFAPFVCADLPDFACGKLTAALAGRLASSLRSGLHHALAMPQGEASSDQSNGWCRTMVCSRSGPVETMAISTPVTSSIRLR